MKWRTEKAPLRVLLFLTALAALAMVLAERSVVLVRQPRYEEKMQAARTVLLATEAIRHEGEARGLVIDAVNDPNETGLIGTEFSLVTTDRGNLISKLTSTNPNFAAVVVDMLHGARLKRGDVVAVGMTGSFPALNTAVVAALEAMELEPLVITSVGASSWGANDPRFSWLDMEALLNDRGLIHTRSLAASIGSGNDNGRGLSPEGRELIVSSIERNGAELIREEILEESVARRMRLFRRAAGKRKIAAYVNVGGGVASLGSTMNGKLFPPGLSRRYRFQNFPAKGVMIRMAESGLPVLHLLKITEIAERYGLPLAPEPLPPLGEGDVFFRPRYDRLRLLLITAALVAATAVTVRLNLRHYLAQIREVRRRGSVPGTSIAAPETARDHPADHFGEIDL